MEEVLIFILSLSITEIISTSLQNIPIDNEGFAVCPDCSTKIQCGTGGVGNLNKRHRGKKPCIEAQRKRDKDAKKKKDGSILAFMKPKPMAVPTTVTPAPLIHAVSGPSHSSTTDTILSRSSSPDISHHIGGFLNRFQRIVGALSESTPVGNSGDRLAAFSAQKLGL